MILAGLALVSGSVLCYSQTSTSAPAAAAAPAAQAPVSADAAKKAFSYYMGYRFGMEVASGASTLTAEDFDKDQFFAAMAASLKGERPGMSQAEIEAGMAAFVETLQAREKAVAAENLKAGQAFEAEYAKKEGVTKTESGLMYRVVTPADGRKYDEAKDGANAIAKVTYEGKLIDGTVFDKSQQAIDMPVDRVVPGFAEAVKLMPIGATYEFCIPAALAYGEQGTGPIKANSTLIFTISLLGIEKAPEAPAGQGMQLTPEMIEALQQQGLPVEEEETPAEAPAAPAEAPAAPAQA